MTPDWLSKLIGWPTCPPALTESIYAAEARRRELVGCGRCDGPLIRREDLRDGLCPSCFDYYSDDDSSAVGVTDDGPPVGHPLTLSWPAGGIQPIRAEDTRSSAAEHTAADGPAGVVSPSPRLRELPPAPPAGHPDLMRLHAENTRLRSELARLKRMYDELLVTGRQAADRLDVAERQRAELMEERDEWRDAHDAVALERDEYAALYRLAIGEDE